MTYKRVMHEGRPHYGKHLMVDCACDHTLRDEGKIRSFVKDLVDNIGMVAFGPVISARFGEGEEEGISAVQLIETSCISLHTNDSTCELYLDVFSCKDFETDKVLECIDFYFMNADQRVREIYRK